MDALVYIVGGLVIAAGGFLVAWLNNGTRMMKRIDELTTQVFDLQRKSAECLAREADLKTEVASALRRLSYMERQTGVGPGEPRQGIVVADLQGVIRAYSPTLTPLFKWLPQELLGKTVLTLVPEDLRDQHKKAFKAFVADEKRETDSSKVILTYGLTKLKERVPIAIWLDGWQVGDQGLLTALIRERATAGPDSAVSETRKEASG